MTQDEIEARRYGKYARHLFELRRDSGVDAVVVLLEAMEADELRTMLLHFIEAGATYDHRGSPNNPS